LSLLKANTNVQATESCTNKIENYEI